MYADYAHEVLWTISNHIRVLRTIKGIMLEKGYYVLRYNTRGAGRSSGWPSLTGFREAKDLQELVQWALATIPSITSVVIMVCSRTHCPPTID